MDPQFQVVDYVVLALTLLISTLMGIFFAYRDRNRNSAEVYFYGKGHMSPLPVGLSLAVSFISAMTIMGYPVEVYLYGIVWIWLLVCFPIVSLIISVYFVPIYHNLRLKCVYKYLELRFGKTARLASSFFVLLYMLIYMSITMYYPALAIAALTPISIPWSIAITCTVCTFYTVIGGFKSVIWTDTFQSCIMLVGSLAILVKLTIAAGGINEVLSAVARGDRDNVLNFDTNPTVRCSFWSILVGNFLSWMIIMATNQADVQRYLSCKTVSQARMSLMYSILPQLVITFISIATGAAMFAYFEGCDPIKNNEIKVNDQLVPLAVGKITSGQPGLKGLFVATIYCGTLSTVSSGINSMSVIILQDFVNIDTRKFPVKYKLRLSKLCTLLLGILTLVLSFVVSLIKGTLVSISYGVASSFGPPVLGMFTLGIFVPWTNNAGALIGGASGFVVTAWISISSLFLKSETSQLLILSTDHCISNQSVVLTNSTLYQNLINITEVQQNVAPFNVYDISVFYFRGIGYFVTLVTGMLASVLTGKNDPATLNPRYFQPVIDNKIFPEKLCKFMRFGVPDISKQNETLLLT